nr:Hypothetical protein CBG15349 [Haemonchus contortus]
MFRKPADDDYPRTVKAKPLPTKYAQKLAMTGKDFVTGGCEGGSGADSKHSACSPESSSANNSLTADERNKISAKILKAELKGDTETVNRLKRKLEGSTTQKREETEKTVVLLKRDRSGNVVPCQRNKSSSENFAQTSSRIHREYGMKKGLNEMMLEEKSSTAEDQLMLFHRSIIAAAV